MGAPAISRDLILEQLERVLANPLFQGAVRSRALLKFLVEEFLNGRIDRLKEYTIGAEALDRSDSFDPRTDPIVRAEASRLRGRLERYYAGEGHSDPLIIAICGAKAHRDAGARTRSRSCLKVTSYTGVHMDWRRLHHRCGRVRVGLVDATPPRSALEPPIDPVRRGIEVFGIARF